MVSHDRNLGELEDYYDLALALGVREARFIPLKILGGACGGDAPTPPPMLDLMLAAHRLFARRPEFRKLAGRDAFSILASTCRLAAPRRSCGAGSQTLLLDADGSLYPCLNLHVPAMKFGSLREPAFDFRAQWREASVLHRVREGVSVASPGNACSRCVVRHWCLGGCHGETFSRHGCLNHCADNCADLRGAILEMFWVLSEDNHVQRQTVWQC
jgi:radical SAM protein with 4Fe4S-binding SPASM domain